MPPPSSAGIGRLPEAATVSTGRKSTKTSAPRAACFEERLHLNKSALLDLTSATTPTSATSHRRVRPLFAGLQQPPGQQLTEPSLGMQSSSFWTRELLTWHPGLQCLHTIEHHSRISSAIPPRRSLGNCQFQNGRARFPLAPEAVEAWRLQLPAAGYRMQSIDFKRYPKHANFEILSRVSHPARRQTH